MKKVILPLSLVTAIVAIAALQFLFAMPNTTPTAVIAEKDARGAAVLLPDKMTSKQSLLLKQAYEIGKADGHKNPEIVQAVLLQETQAGGLKSYRVANPGGEAYFGPMQLKLAAARDVLARWPSLFEKYGFHTRTDDEVKANLILNDRFNIEVGSKYLMVLHRTYGYSGRDLLNAYNRGPGGVKTVDASYHYAVGAEQKLAAFKRMRS